MPQSRATQLSRRGLLTAGGAVSLGALLAACGDKGGTGGPESGTGGKRPWSFKDDRGEAASTDALPKNIVAFTGTAAALYDYGIKVKGVFGPTRGAGGGSDVQAGDLDISELEILGNEWGQFNVEKYAALAPELLITDM